MKNSKTIFQVHTINDLCNICSLKCFAIHVSFSHRRKGIVQSLHQQVRRSLSILSHQKVDTHCKCIRPNLRSFPLHQSLAVRVQSSSVRRGRSGLNHVTDNMKCLSSMITHRRENKERKNVNQTDQFHLVR
jgi:hypothetical protein